MSIQTTNKPGSLVVKLKDGSDFVMYTPTPKQLEFHESSIRNLCAIGNRGGGKLCHLDTVIPTSNGYSTMREVQVGDIVFDERGVPCSVIHKSEPEVDPEGTYKLTFDDGAWVICGANHEWWVFDKRARDRLRRQKPEYRERRRFTRTDSPIPKKRRHAEISAEQGRVVLTKDIAQNPVFITGTYRETNFAIRVAGPLQLAMASLPVDPYTLGVWLGDGSKNSGQITGLDPEIFEFIRAKGYVVNQSEVDSKSWYVRGLIQGLRRVGVLGNKHIPSEYFLGSIEQRLSLLQGLMDTDGNCEADGKAEFCNTNIRLARGVYRLAASLGLKPSWSEGRAKLNGKDCGPKYRVAWTSTTQVFRIPRKATRIKTKVRRTQEFRFIVKVERVPDEPMQCIQVDSPSHLYLCTESCIPTHNSLMLRMDAHMRALACPGSSLVLIRKTYKDLLKNHVFFQGLPWGSLKAEMKLLGGDFNRTDYICHYPNGSKLFLSYVGHETDALNLLGAELLGAYFDEISTIPWEYFLQLSASVRVPAGTGWQSVIRGATNPLGESAREVIQYFKDKDVDLAEDQDYSFNDWGHIQINMEDNPHQDPEYRKNLISLNLPEHIRKAWIEGEYMDEGAMFSFYPTKDDKPYHVLPELDIPNLIKKARQIYRVYDHGYRDPAVCLWIAHLGDRYIVFHELVLYETPVPDIAAAIKEEEELIGLRDEVNGKIPNIITYCDPSIDVKTGDIRTIRDLFEMNGIPMECSINNREQFASAVHTALAEEVEPGIPRLRIYGNGPRVGCPYLIKALPIQKFDPKHPQKLADHKHDHPVVALAYFLISHSADELKTFEAKKPKPWMKPKRRDNWTLGKSNVRSRYISR